MAATVLPDPGRKPPPSCGSRPSSSRLRAGKGGRVSHCFLRHNIRGPLHWRPLYQGIPSSAVTTSPVSGPISCRFGQIINDALADFECAHTQSGSGLVTHKRTMADPRPVANRVHGVPGPPGHHPHRRHRHQPGEEHALSYHQV